MVVVLLAVAAVVFGRGGGSQRKSIPRGRGGGEKE